MKINWLTVCLLIVILSLASIFFKGSKNDTNIQKALKGAQNATCQANRRNLQAIFQSMVVEGFIMDHTEIDFEAIWNGTSQIPNINQYVQKELVCPQGGIFSIDQNFKISCSKHKAFKWDDKHP